jgi:hypothetical protein
VPAEVKRARGTARPDRMPKLAAVAPLPPAERLPDAPADFGPDALRLWHMAWGTAITWLSPHSDIEIVEQTCRLADDLSIARDRYRETAEPKEGRLVATFSRELVSALASLGFDPAARSRLGVTEVTRVSKLAALRERHDGR